MAQRRPTKCRSHQCVYRRRIRQQGHCGNLPRHSSAALEESQRPGDDADHPRRGAFHRARPARFRGPDEGRVLQGRPDQCARHVRRLQQRPLRAARRRLELERHHLASLPAPSDALSRRNGSDEHAATQRAELARWPAGDRHHRADHSESRAEARNRSSRHPVRQLPRRKGAVRTTVGAEQTKACDQRIPQASTRSRRGAVQVARAKRIGSKARGVGVSLSCFHGGTTGFDGLIVIRPDGRICFQSGIGNLGTESVIDVHRAGAEVLGVPWEKCDVVWGDTSKHLPWTSPQGGSQTTYAMTRAAHAAATDARKKLQEIAAKTLGGRPEEYEVANERVFRKTGDAGMTLAQAARRAIDLGGRYDGHEAPADVNSFTKASVAALAGQGLVAAAKDKYPADGVAFSYVASFAEVEVDLETGGYALIDYLCCADVGTILDVPVDMKWEALNIPDPETPIGARGIGEPPVGGACASILNALSDALGDEIFRRAPVNLDTILTSLEAGRPMQHPLTAHI